MLAICMVAFHLAAAEPVAEQPSPSCQLPSYRKLTLQGFRELGGPGPEKVRVPTFSFAAREFETLPPIAKLSETDVLKHLGNTQWPLRSNADVPVTGDYRTLKEHIRDALSTEPVFVDNYVADVALRDVLRPVPEVFRDARKRPLALVAKSGQGLRIHSITEPRWLVQTHGRTTWTLMPSHVRYNRSAPACDTQPPEGALICETEPGTGIFIPGGWGLGSCAVLADNSEGSALSIAVGAGGRSAYWPPEFHTVADGDIDRMKKVLKADPQLVDYGDPLTGMSPMELTSLLGDMKMVKLLEKHGGRPSDTGNFEHLYPIHHAASVGHTTLLQWLLEKSSAPDTEAKKRLTPLHMAASFGRVGTFEILLKHRADVFIGDSDRKHTALHFAVSGGHVAVLKALKSLTNVEFSAVDSRGCEPTALAVMSGHAPVLRFLLEGEDLNPDAQCDHGRAPVHFAAQGNRPYLLQILREKGANMAIKDDGANQPLHTAIRFGALDAIDWYASAKIKRASPAKTPGLLHLAAYTDSLRSLERLLHHGADVSKKDLKAKTPPIDAVISQRGLEILERAGAKVPEPGSGFVHKAAAREAISLLEYLVDNRGHSVNEDYQGLKPVHVAAEGLSLQMLHWLCVKRNANCCEEAGESSWRRNPLHFAASAKTEPKKGARLEVVEHLLQHKCDPLVPDSKRISAFELAAAIGNLDMVKKLVAIGSPIELLWKLKKNGMLHSQVEKWATASSPPGAYGKWLQELPEEDLGVNDYETSASPDKDEL